MVFKLISPPISIIERIVLSKNLNNKLVVAAESHINFHVIIAGLVILVIVEALRIGVDMKEEQDFTVYWVFALTWT